MFYPQTWEGSRVALEDLDIDLTSHVVRLISLSDMRRAIERMIIFCGL